MTGEGGASFGVDLPVLLSGRGPFAEVGPLGRIIGVVAPRMPPVVPYGDGALVGLLHAQRDAAGLFVVRQHAHPHIVADGDYVGDVGDEAVRELGDVDESGQVAGLQRYEDAEGLDAVHHAAQLVARRQLHGGHGRPP